MGQRKRFHIGNAAGTGTCQHTFDIIRRLLFYQRLQNIDIAYIALAGRRIEFFRLRGAALCSGRRRLRRGRDRLGIGRIARNFLRGWSGGDRGRIVLRRRDILLKLSEKPCLDRFG